MGPSQAKDLGLSEQAIRRVDAWEKNPRVYREHISQNDVSWIGALPESSQTSVKLFEDGCMGLCSEVLSECEADLMASGLLSVVDRKPFSIRPMTRS